MTTGTDFSPLGTAAGLDEAKAGIKHAIRSIAAQAAAWIETCADYYAAAALYEQLAELSDAELRRRGLSRGTLAADLARWCDRTSG